MEVQFLKTNPTGNTTILVENCVEREAQVSVAAALMSDGFLCAEQVGFIERARIPGARSRLQMAGGEFCGNAAMSLAAFLVWRGGEGCEHGARVLLEVSGAEEAIECVIRPGRAGENEYLGTVRMPPPENIGVMTLPLAGLDLSLTAVRLPGITHVVVPLGVFDAREPCRDPRELAALAVREWAPLIDAEAFGVLLYDPKTQSITPLVHVKTSGATVWEHGCGSGSAAVGAYMALAGMKSVTANISQPGGVIEVDARFKDGAVAGVSITGNVRITARGTAYI
jgi:diaminopimelate epimerase